MRCEGNLGVENIPAELLDFSESPSILDGILRIQGHVIKHSRFHTSLKALAYPCAAKFFKQTRGPIDDPRDHFTGDEIKRFKRLRDLFESAVCEFVHENYDPWKIVSN